MLDDDEMTSSRPYFIRAIYDWLVDNGLTPHLLVNAEARGVQVPSQYVDKGQVVLNISPSAIQNMVLGDDAMRFSARFSGVATSLYIPIAAVQAIYARENGRGMVFGEEDEAPPPTPDPTPDSDKKPALRIVK